jgi:hypothetical protein
LINFSIEPPEYENDVKKKSIICDCFEKKENEEDEKKRVMMAELIDNAPVKDELVTHDGVVYFPKELFPPELEETLQHSARLGLMGNAASHYLLKSRKLNLKLKIKRPKTLKMMSNNSNAPTLMPMTMHRNSLQFGSQIKNHKLNPQIMNLNMTALRTQDRFEKPVGHGFQTERIKTENEDDTPSKLRKQ